MKKKMKIYVKLANLKRFDLSNGDKITETNLYKAMSTFSEVYYDGYLFNPKENGFSISSKHSGLSVRDYDICFIRGGATEFWDLFNSRGSSNTKLLWNGSPYDEKIYNNADGIVTYTKSWARQLANYNKDPVGGFYQKNIYIPNNIITFPQSICREKFSSKAGHKKTIEFRKKFDADFVIGHFGRLSDSCYPHSLIHIFPEIKRKYPNKKIKLIYLGLKAQNKIGKKSSSVKKMSSVISNLGSACHEDMPYAISACDMIASNYRVGSANWGGSMHVLEAASCGIPILTGDFSVRKEQLGDDYPLFWPWKENSGRVSVRAEKVMLMHISNIIENPSVGKRIGLSISNRMRNYSTDCVGKEIESEIKRVFGENYG